MTTLRLLVNGVPCYLPLADDERTIEEREADHARFEAWSKRVAAATHAVQAILDPLPADEREAVLDMFRTRPEEP